MILPVLFAKFLSAGAVAQAATGAGVVLVAVTGVGAVGALPAPVQDTFSTVVAAVTPLEAPTSEEAADGTTAEENLPETVPATIPDADAEDATTEDAAFDVDAWIAAGPDGYDSFGAWVSESVHNPDLKAALRAQGRNFGSVVSQWAGKKGLGEAELVAEGVDLDALTEVPAEPETDVVLEEVPETQPEVAATTETRGNGSGKATGNGGGQGNGKGNGKN